MLIATHWQYQLTGQSTRKKEGKERKINNNKQESTIKLYYHH
jgi:hypothetical protein